MECTKLSSIKKRSFKPKYCYKILSSIVITQHTLKAKGRLDVILDEIRKIWRNNLIIMNRIRAATGSLGLIINQDEVFSSPELLACGKTPVFRGKVLPLETKRWSRISTVTNDQIRSFANSLEKDTTAVLAVCHNSKYPIEILKQCNFTATFYI